jgi:hypothetical protein
MAILNYSTKIDSIKTIGEITQCLVKHGANKIVSDYENGIPVSVTFTIMLKDNPVFYSLPANYNGVLKAMEKTKGVARSLCTKEQAIRVSWRIIKDWVEAQMAIVEADLADIAEVFLPYAITPSGNTLYQEIRDNNQKLLK